MNNKPKGFLAVLGADVFNPTEQKPKPIVTKEEQAKQMAQSLIDSFLVAQYKAGDMKSHRLLAIESSIVAVNFFLNKSRKGNDYDYSLYEECRSQLIALLQDCV